MIGRRVGLVAGLAALFAFALGGFFAAPANADASVGATSPPGGFSPSSVTIDVGETVTWTNNDPVGDAVTHTATGDGFNVNLPPGGSGSHTFDTAGTFPYHCTIHPTMTGTINVNEAATTTTTAPTTTTTQATTSTTRAATTTTAASTTSATSASTSSSSSSSSTSSSSTSSSSTSSSSTTSTTAPTSSTTADPGGGGGSGTTVLLIVAIVVVLGGIAAVGLYLYRSRYAYDDDEGGPSPYDPTQYQ